MKSNDKDFNDWLSQEITDYFDIFQVSFLTIVCRLAYTVTHQTSDVLPEICLSTFQSNNRHNFIFLFFKKQDTEWIGY